MTDASEGGNATTKSEEKKDIKIFVSHRIDLDSETIDNPLYVNVRCGAVFDERENVEMLGDDTGDNISEKRESYCELTVMYWAWKNVKADYYGLCHYRRYLSFSQQKLSEDIWGNIEYEYIDKRAIDEMNLSVLAMEGEIPKYDFIIGTAFKTSSTVRQQYDSIPYLRVEDLDLATAIIKKLYPEYSIAVDQYINGKVFYPCLLFIMKKELFFEYCEWAFKIFSQLEKELDVKQYGRNATRTIGHIGERLLGIYYTYLKQKNIYKFKELQHSIFWSPEKQEELLPYYPKSNVPIVLSASDFYAPYAAATLMSVVKNSSQNKNYDIVFLHTGISKTAKTILEKVLEGNDNFNIRYHNVKPIMSRYKPVANNHVSVETFNRLAVQILFTNYEKVIYLDSDLIVQTDVAQLIDINLDGYLIAAARDPDYISQYSGAIKKIKKYTDEVLQLKNPYDYFQAGVLLLNIPEMKKSFKNDELLDYSEKREYMYVDQDVLNVKCQGKVYQLNMQWNTMTDCGGARKQNIENFAPLYVLNEYLEARKSPKIIHYAGYLKPWNDCTSDYAFEFWDTVRNSFLYEILLSRLGSDVSWHTTSHFLNHQKQIQDGRKLSVRLKNRIKRIIFFILPPGTQRHQTIKGIYKKFKRIH